jgi:transposase, IS5 family
LSGRGVLGWFTFEAVAGSGVGRATGTLVLLRCLLLQQWYRLSDPALEEALADRLSFRR